jgi:hypothetical protein
MRVLLATLVALGGCGLDESYTGLGAGALPGDPLNPNGGGGACAVERADAGWIDAGVLNVADLTGAAYRMDALHFSRPLTGTIGTSFNQYFVDSIADGSLNVLVAVDGDNRATFALDLRCGGGAPVAGGYQLVADPAPGQLGCELQGTIFETLTPGTIVFPSAMLEPPELPIEDVYLSGWFASDGSSIGHGQIVGVLTAEGAISTGMGGTDLATLLDTLDIPPDLDFDGDTVAEAWRFLGTFSALQVTLVP